MTTAVMVGSVWSFDEAAGLGEVVSDAGGEPVRFHCTAITDGTRTIAVGARVVYTLTAAHLGCLEAAAVTRLG